eukprot:CAMPEP_0175061810 /NCGR_PEP_ID=MMETSP0052_2-20121109/13798_1 /TAXON_ID=51329 ORGANISM="Polytomella parva, Strain SAG 63-3" /NCGR_SAMPLE_ID=MMETSP0052_2 /ASSEMBLY_ACC=CAM_ASM_000194 /LENGTH=59 /DNA_ID=CAMNT_0016327719 /DNA_START=401 /DNA_END=580 /DNA_ORIENTATION=+
MELVAKRASDAAAGQFQMDLDPVREAARVQKIGDALTDALEGGGAEDCGRGRQMEKRGG